MIETKPLPGPEVQTPKTDPRTNLPIGEMGNRFSKAMKEGLEAAKNADKPAPIAPPEAPPAAQEPVSDKAKASEAPKTLPDIKNAPKIPDTPSISDDILNPKDKKGDRIGKSAAAELNFKQLEAKRAELEKANQESIAKINELTTQIESWRKGEAPEVAGMKKELEKYQELVSRYYLEHDPRFQAAFDSKIEQSIADAKEVVGEANAAKVEQILRMPDGETKTAMLKEMAGELEDFEAIGLRRAYDDIRKLNRERQAELSKAKENVQKIKEFESLSKAEEATKTAQERSTFAESVLLEAAQYMPEFQEVPGRDDFNKQVKENIGHVKAFMAAPLTPQQQSQLAVWAVRGYRSAEREQAQVAIIEKLKSAIEALQGAQPGIENTGEAKTVEEAPTVEGMAGKFRKFMAGQTSK